MGAIVWLNEFRWRRWGELVRPIGYGLTLALVQLKGQMLFDHSLLLVIHQQEEFQIVVPLWSSELATGLLLIAVVARLLSSGGASWTGRPMLVGLIVATVVVRLDRDSVGRFARLGDQQPLAGSERSLEFRVRNRRVKFATDAFFFQEGTAQLYAQARYGEFRVAADGGLLLTGMRGESLQRLGPPEDK